MILLFLALDHFVFCLLPKKNMQPSTKKNTRKAAVIRSGAYFANDASISGSPGELWNLGRNEK